MQATSTPKTITPARTRLRRPPRLISVETAEPALETAARASVLWPLYVAVAVVTFPGGLIPASSGVLGLAACFLLMVLLALRGAALEWVRVARFAAAVVGAGFLGELLALGLSGGEGPSAFERLEPVARAAALWLLAVFIYEVTPVVATASRLIEPERDAPSGLHKLRGSLVAHAMFIALAALGYLYGPTLRSTGTTWFVSPWMVAAIAMTFTAPRCAPSRVSTPLRPHSHARLGIALTALPLLVAVMVRNRSELVHTFHHMRWGVGAMWGGALTFGALGVVLPLGVALGLLWRSQRAGHAPTGVVGAPAGGSSVLLDCPGLRRPVHVLLDSGSPPPAGTTVTLLGVSRPVPESGPFRDSADRIAARQLYPGSPAELRRALRERAGGYFLAAVVAALGMFLILHPILR